MQENMEKLTQVELMETKNLMKDIEKCTHIQKMVIQAYIKGMLTNTMKEG